MRVLGQLGIRTIGELAQAPLERQRAVFGSSYSVFLHQAARGIDDRPIVTYREPKTMSRERTFAHDIGDWPTISKRLAELAHQVAEDLRADGYVGRKVGIKLRYADFKTHTRETSLNIPSADPAEIRIITDNAVQMSADVHHNSISNNLSGKRSACRSWDES